MKRILILILILVSGCCQQQVEIKQIDKVVLVLDTKQIEPTPILTDFDTYKTYAEHYELYNSKQLDLTPDIKTKELVDLAAQLKGNSVEQTIFYTKEFADSIDYKFYYYPRGVMLTLDTMEGDCTDKTQLAVVLLKLNGIYAKPVHGYLNETIMHDWVEVLYPDPDIKAVSWQPLDNNSSLIKVGDGVW